MVWKGDPPILRVDIHEYEVLESLYKALKSQNIQVSPVETGGKKGAYFCQLTYTGTEYNLEQLNRMSSRILVPGKPSPSDPYIHSIFVLAHAQTESGHRQQTPEQSAADARYIAQAMMKYECTVSRDANPDPEYRNYTPLCICIKIKDDPAISARAKRAEIGELENCFQRFGFTLEWEEGREGNQAVDWLRIRDHPARIPGGVTKLLDLIKPYQTPNTPPVSQLNDINNIPKTGPKKTPSRH